MVVVRGKGPRFDRGELAPKYPFKFKPSSDIISGREKIKKAFEQEYGKIRERDPSEMELVISEGSWKGTCAEFAKFRHHLAVVSEVGVKPAPEEVSKYQEFIPNVDYEIYDDSCSLGQWDEPPPEILDVLFVHSDKDGEISPNLLKPLAERLADIVKEVSENPFRQSEEDNTFLEQTKKMVHGFVKAAQKDQPVTFKAS